MSSASRDTLRALWATIEESSTLPEQAAILTSIYPDTVPALELPRPRRVPIELRGELGRGGMGVVYLGYQASLRREVAVKLVPQRGASRDRHAAVREALVAGYLEHPNIAPVYTVEESEEGDPLIVMKRLEGVAWSDCIEDPTLAPRMRADDPLSWHLGVFAAVCRAVQFAHERGILHRDIKPDNVHIGPHGDVYLLDWGLAVALDPALRERVPLASEVSRMAGTPGYMAPEMVAADGVALGPRTDVYLLGATLHEVLTTQARHPGDDLRVVLASSVRSAPVEYGGHVPAELGSICNRATHRDPSARYASAAELAAAVRSFQEKRPALRFLADGRALLGRMKGLIESSTGTDAELAAIYETMGACRMAFDEALRVWPGHAIAVVERDEALRVMAAFEMERGSLDDAHDLLCRMSHRDAVLHDRLGALRQRAAASQQEYARLKKLERDVSWLRGRAKAVVAALLGVGVFAHNIVYGHLDRVEAIDDSPAMVLVGPVIVLSALAALRFFGRRGLFRNRLSRQMLYVLSAIGAAVLGIRVMGTLHGVPPVQTYAYIGGVYAFGAAQAAVMTDRRIYASAAILGVGSIATLVFPQLTFEIIGTSVLLAMSLMAAVWWRREASESGS